MGNAASKPVRPLVISELKPPLKPTLVTDESGLAQLKDFFSRASVFGFDIETNVVPTFFNRRIRTIQVGDKNEQYVIDLLAFAGDTRTLVEGQGNYTPHPNLLPVVHTLRTALESREWLKVGTNLQFDYETAKWCLGLRPWNFYDCQLAEKVLHAGAVNYFILDFWALDDIARRYFGLVISKEEQTSFNLVDPLTESQVNYAALDTRLPLGIKQAQLEPLRKANLLRVVQIENDAIPAFGDMHLNGMKVDADEWMKLVRAEEEKKRAVVARLDQFFLPVTGQKSIPSHDLIALETEWRETPSAQKELRAERRQQFVSARREIREATEAFETYEGEAAINYSSHSQIKPALLMLGIDGRKLPDTNDDTLKKLSDIPNLRTSDEYERDPTLQHLGPIDALRFHRAVDKILTTYGESFLEKYTNPDTGRIHSDHQQIGAETGRTSSRNPNLQNILSGANWRGCFIARPGYKLVTVDYNGQELRIMAELSGEQTWVQAFNNGWDVHSVVGELLFGQLWKDMAEEGCAYYTNHQKCKCSEHKKLRDKTLKTLNFGIAYGLSPKSLAISLRITKQEAKDLLRDYAHILPTLTHWLEIAGKNAKMYMESRTLAQRRRKYRQPDWGVARAKLAHKLKRLPTSDEVNRQFQGMYAHIEREGRNTPVQGSGADMMKLAMGCGFDPNGKPYLWHRLEPDFSAQLLNMVHDEFVIEAADALAQPCLEVVMDCMERAGSEFVKRVAMPAEGHIDTKWTKE